MHAAHIHRVIPSCMVYVHQTHLDLKLCFKSYWSKAEPPTVGPNCQVYLPPPANIEEREENEIGRSRPLNGWFFSPNERRGKGDEYETCKEADGRLREQN